MGRVGSSVHISLTDTPVEDTVINGVGAGCVSHSCIHGALTQLGSGTVSSRHAVAQRTTLQAHPLNALGAALGKFE